MMTEEATPLETYLNTLEHGSDHLIRWGLHQIMVRQYCNNLL